MSATTHPDKQQVRQWLQNQLRAHCPPPSPGQIREALDWHGLPRGNKCDPSHKK
ncbi:hypothetical protein V8J88_13990 [Massilia sp. W12]|uniref:hypothetical protein n=1 Tax=Massilia sp. W12 TaxID=3126507 RepID=UPI0030CEBD28